VTDAQRDAGEAAVIAAIGSSVRQARLRTGLSTRELAQRASLSQPFLSNIENGRSSPSVATLCSQRPPTRASSWSAPVRA
jgi:ribosome-binding protein aMBF1 (putative translation factor)